MSIVRERIVQSQLNPSFEPVSCQILVVDVKVTIPGVTPTFVEQNLLAASTHSICWGISSQFSALRIWVLRSNATTTTSGSSRSVSHKWPRLPTHVTLNSRAPPLPSRNPGVKAVEALASSRSRYKLCLGTCPHADLCFTMPLQGTARSS